MNSFPLVSVYTCVYNGSRTIERVFHSLRNLDYPNFEHIIVNDGSTDDTEEKIKEYIDSVSFPVKYHKKENGGKHTALNAAWDLAEGDFLIQLDADDELLPHSVRYLVTTYFQIPESIRSEYWCVHGRCISQHQKFIGDPYPENINNQHWTAACEDAKKYHGEKVGLQVRSFLVNYRFPEVIGVSYIPEGIIWRQLERQYGTWYTNEVVRIYYVGEGNNLTASKRRRNQFSPLAYKYKWHLMHQDWYGRSLGDLLRYALFYFISDKKYRDNNGYLDGLHHQKLILILLSPAAFIGAILVRLYKHIQ